MPVFDYAKQCCFCGANNEHEPRGYAGERTCSSCGKGGYGEPDEPNMACYAKSVTQEADNAGDV